MTTYIYVVTEGSLGDDYCAVYRKAHRTFEAAVRYLNRAIKEDFPDYWDELQTSDPVKNGDDYWELFLEEVSGTTYWTITRVALG